MCSDVEVLVKSSTAVKDNTCQRCGRCKPGLEVAKDNCTCAVCGHGKYNPRTTGSGHACEHKCRPQRCAAGQRLALGASRERDDWRCTRCLPGHFMAYERVIDWTDWAHGIVPRSLLACDVKTNQGLHSCAASDPSTYLHKGGSVLRDDWQCRSAALVVALCQRHFKNFTRSTLPGVMVGMPGLVMPFTRGCSAAVKVPGVSSQPSSFPDMFRCIPTDVTPNQTPVYTVHMRTCCLADMTCIDVVCTFNTHTPHAWCTVAIRTKSKATFKKQH